MQLPTGYEEKYRRLMGDTEATAFFQSFDQPVRHGFRINPLKAQSKPTELSLAEPTAILNGFIGRVNGHTPDHTTGVVYSQEPSAMYVGAVVDAKPNERILDLCAAPGGKTTQLAAGLQQTGLLVTNEIFAKRAAILSENVERCGIMNAVVTNETPARLAKQLPTFFDKVVVDAPCSGEGMFRKDPAAMDYWTPDYPATCATRQREILTEAVKMVRPGGTLVYSTCTFAPEEDEQMMAWLLATYPEFELVDLPALPGLEPARPSWADDDPRLARAGRLFPHHVAGEGHFVAKLVRKASETDGVKKLKPVALPRPDREAIDLWQAFVTAHLPADWHERTLTVFGEQLYALPAGTPDLGRLRIVRPGLHLGTLKKRRFEPAFALALAIHPADYQPRVALTTAQWATYVHGDVVNLTDAAGTTGWALATINGNGIGFGKVVGNTLKNGYPKGLRFQA
ncbi:RsmF rRNA methyltransferase first C-terminal domain-containing protein [Furfurilactobacillus sp. WILCCON 0119]